MRVLIGPHFSYLPSSVLGFGMDLLKSEPSENKGEPLLYRPPHKKEPHKETEPKIFGNKRKSGAVILRLVWNTPFLK